MKAAASILIFILAALIVTPQIVTMSSASDSEPVLLTLDVCGSARSATSPGLVFDGLVPPLFSIYVPVLADHPRRAVVPLYISIVSEMPLKPPAV